MVIDPQRELIFPATLTTSPQPHVVGLIDALPKLSDRYHLHDACTLSCPSEHGEVSFPLLNPSDTPLALHKGSVISKFEQLTFPTDMVTLTPNDRLCTNDASLQQECPAQSLLAPLCMPADDFHLQLNSLPNPSLTAAGNMKLSELLTNLSDTFTSSFLVQHEIDTGDVRPIKVQVTQTFAPHFNYYLERLGQKTFAGNIFLFLKQTCGFKTELKIGNVRSEGQKFLNPFVH